MTNPTKAKLTAAAGLLLPLIAVAPASAAVNGLSLGKAPTVSALAQPAGVCSRRAGPYVTQYTANLRRRQAIAHGFRVSGVFPNGGGYAFNVFFAC